MPKEPTISSRPKLLIPLLALSLHACAADGPFRAPVCEQRLPSGSTVKVTSCQLVWGADHDRRIPSQDAFALEYVSSLPRSAGDELDREALEVFELIRGVSERWGFTTASVSAFPTDERTGPYVRYAFSRSTAGGWTFQREEAKVFNTESGRKPD